MSDRTFRRNVVVNTIGESIWGLKSNMVVSSVVLAMLLHQFGASPLAIGSIGAIEASMLLLPQMLGGYIFHSRAKRKVQLVIWHYAVMLPFHLVMGIATFFSDHLSPGIYSAVMLVSFAGFMGSIGVVGASWFEYFYGTIFSGGRGSALGLSIFGSSLAGTGGTLFAGALIRSLPFPQAYAWLYIIAWFLGVLSITCFLFIKDEGETEAAVQPRPSASDLWKSLRASLGVPNFRTYLIGRAIALSAFGIMPFIAIHFTSPAGGSLAKGYVVSLYAAFTIANAGGSLIMGRIGDRIGYRPGILLAAAMQCVCLLFAIFLPGTAGCLATYFCAGLAAACTFVSNSNLIIEMCPHGNRVAHIATANLLLGVPSLIAPMLAGWLAAAGGIVPLFILSAVLSSVAFVWLSFRFRDPRRLAKGTASCA
jgi:MFS family permease